MPNPCPGATAKALPCSYQMQILPLFSGFTALLPSHRPGSTAPIPLTLYVGPHQSAYPTGPLLTKATTGLLIPHSLADIAQFLHIFFLNMLNTVSVLLITSN